MSQKQDRSTDESEEPLPADPYADPSEKLTVVNQYKKDVVCAEWQLDAATYFSRENCLWRRFPKKDDKPTLVQRLATFDARILEERLIDDGIETQREYELEGTVAGRTSSFVISAMEFPHVVTWAHKHLGARAAVSAITHREALVAEAIQQLSEPVERRVYAHTGWQEVAPGQWAYLTAAGALGDGGLIPDLQVKLAAPLDRYWLDGAGDGGAGVKASLSMLESFPMRITAPLLGVVWRSVLGPSDSVLSLVGVTGTGKSELAALAQRHFGPGFDAKHLPASWSASAAVLSGWASKAADTLLFVDDYAPTPVTAKSLAVTAEQIIRGIGNGAGRSRARRDGTQRPEAPPRGSIASTGEDTPQGASLMGRMLTIELALGEFTLSDLTSHQAAAARGEFAAGMAAYIRWLAGDLPVHRALFAARAVELRAEIEAGGAHSRAPSAVAELLAAWELWSRFAIAGGHLTIDEASTLLQRVRWALLNTLQDQASLQTTTDPCRLLLQSLASAIASGDAHLAGPDGEMPTTATRWGWRQDADPFGGTVRPLGSRIGWVSDEGVFLDQTASLAIARRMAQASGDPLTCTAHTLCKRLYERGLLANSSISNGRQTYSVRKILGGERRSVLHLPLDALADGVEDAQVEQFVAELEDLVEQTRPAA